MIMIRLFYCFTAIDLYFDNIVSSLLHEYEVMADNAMQPTGYIDHHVDKSLLLKLHFA